MFMFKTGCINHVGWFTSLKSVFSQNWRRWVFSSRKIKSWCILRHDFNEWDPELQSKFNYKWSLIEMIIMINHVSSHHEQIVNWWGPCVSVSVFFFHVHDRERTWGRWMKTVKKEHRFRETVINYTTWTAVSSNTSLIALSSRMKRCSNQIMMKTWFTSVKQCSPWVIVNMMEPQNMVTVPKGNNHTFLKVWPRARSELSRPADIPISPIKDWPEQWTKERIFPQVIKAENQWENLSFSGTRTEVMAECLKIHDQICDSLSLFGLSGWNSEHLPRSIIKNFLHSELTAPNKTRC